MPAYTPSIIEPKWQAYWLDQNTFRTPDPGEDSIEGKPKYYILDMFPYPSGEGLHVGHPEGYTATDILARYKRMTGHHVLHPIGWDAFGLPAEEYARKTGTHPRLTTAKNINNFRRQIRSLGFSYDWNREVNTTDPDYFRWTQWIFLILHDTYFDPDTNTGRPIRELMIPDVIQAMGEVAVSDFVNSRRLAYQADAMVNWCAAMGTVLANEEVVEGKSDIGGHPVERRPLRQWLLRITTYAERLINDLELVDWPESIKKMQRQWIGRSEGAEVAFQLAREVLELAARRELIFETSLLEVFTTRPDTLYGATYLVVAPEHPMLDLITTPEQAEAVADYIKLAAAKSDKERTEQSKTGVFTGGYAINPANSERVPIWVADYVLGGYGTGAIMAVPAHDERDFAFAQAFGLPIVTVVEPSADWLAATGSTRDHLTAAYTGDGVAINSGPLDTMTTAEAKEAIITKLEAGNNGSRQVNYKLRDWLFSRQRYWGEPFPLLHELDDSGEPTGVVRRLSPDDLPLKLPELEDFGPTGSPAGPLAKLTDWVYLTLDGKRYKRETNTMPQWAGSCWYYLRYIDPHNTTMIGDVEKLNYWLPVDLYVGGAEHAVLHLLYSRFWHKVLYDRGLVGCAEPFQRLVNQGMILGDPDYQISEAVHDANRGKLAELGIVARHRAENVDGGYSLTLDGKKLPDTLTEKRKGKFYIKGTDIEMASRAEKMSKSRGNVVNPDDVVRDYGADSLRLYEMFMGPLEATKPWNTKDIEGVSRFLGRVWRLIVDDGAELMQRNTQISDAAPAEQTLRMMHRTIRKVTDDTEAMRFNTAIAAMMEFTNHLTGLPTRPRVTLENLTLLLSPYAPHLAEELWAVLGHSPSISQAPWPMSDPALCVEPSIEIPVQVGGKVKARLQVSPGLADDEMQRLALADAAVVAAMAGRPAKMIKVVPGRLVNIVL